MITNGKNAPAQSIEHHSGDVRMCTKCEKTIWGMKKVSYSVRSQLLIIKLFNVYKIVTICLVTFSMKMTE